MPKRREPSRGSLFYFKASYFSPIYSLKTFPPIYFKHKILKHGKSDVRDAVDVRLFLNKDFYLIEIF